MVRKQELDSEVAGLKEKLSKAKQTDASGNDKRASQARPRASPDNPAHGAASEPDRPIQESLADLQEGQIDLAEIEQVLKEHGLEFDGLKELLERFATELKDLPANKPLVTVTGAFLLGFAAGRMSSR